MNKAREYEKIGDEGVHGNGRGHARRRGGRVGWVALPCLLAGMATESHAAHVVLEATPIRVRYSQGELTNPAAARHLLKRIGDAALESCGASTFSVAEVKTAIRASRCWKDAVDDAIRRIGSPVLSAALVEDR